MTVVAYRSVEGVRLTKHRMPYVLERKKEKKKKKKSKKEKRL